MPPGKNRFIAPELLDDETPERAAPSLRDLVRINRLLGGHRVLRTTLRTCFRQSDRFSLLDVGAASGDACAVVASEYPRAYVVSLDHRAYHMANARSHRIAADAFHLPLKARSFDVVYCGLFLHHFPDDAVVNLLQNFAAIARKFVIVNDLERHFLPWIFVPATTWIFNWDPITQHDAPVSVRAGFTPLELQNLAARAGLANTVVRRFRPAFRLSLIGQPPSL